MTQGRKENIVSYRLTRLRGSVIQVRMELIQKKLVEKATGNL